jgi:uracil-DNA glycosylase family 4
MTDETRKELTAWLEFYQELGIEGFYRREPGEVDFPPNVESAQMLQPVMTAAANPVPSPVPARVAAPPAAARPITPSKLAASATPVRAVIPAPAAEFNLFEAPPPPPSGPETLEQIRQDLGDCHRCKLAPTRKTIVFGDGNPHAELVFIGEGPGADEDEQGLPFVGRAGKLLNKMIQMVGLKREDVYICNIVKCRPPGNRTPETDEIDTCSPFLYRQIDAIKPRLICCLGAPAARTVLGIKEGITKVHGHFYNFGSIKALPTVHPAYVLRNMREEKILIEDFEKIRDFLKGA